MHYISFLTMVRTRSWTLSGNLGCSCLDINPTDTEPIGLAPMVFAVIFSCFNVAYNKRPIKPGAALEAISMAFLVAFFLLNFGACDPHGQ